MAHKKAGGKTKNGRDSRSNRLGVKLFGGQEAQPGNILIRQRGTKYAAGEGTNIGKDHTIYAVTAGSVAFSEHRKQRFTGLTRRQTVVQVKTQ